MFDENSFFCKLGFSCGPSFKGAHWRSSSLDNALIGQAHFLPPARERINQLRTALHIKLQLPKSYKVLLINGGCTGAIDCILANLAYKRSITALIWDEFAALWADDAEYFGANVRKLHLNHNQTGIFSHNYTQSDDLLFTWTSTIRGIRPNSDAFLETTGLKICDATATVMIEPLPWDKLDAIAFSFQKGIGAEPGIGAIVLSPKAQEVLAKSQHYVIKMFRLKTLISDDHITSTISMLGVEDALQQLNEIESLDNNIKRASENRKLVENYMLDSLYFKPVICSFYQSNSAFCFQLRKDYGDQTWEKVIQLVQKSQLIELQGDFRFVPCFRIWLGPWLDPEYIKKALDTLTQAAKELNIES